MRTYEGELAYEHGRPEKIGVLLCNLGSPEAATPSALRRYLREFLTDPRVIELSRAIWLPLLHGVILPLRAPRAAAAYAKIWLAEGSPLLVYTKRQRDAVDARLEEIWPSRIVTKMAMRYGEPSIADGLRALRDANARRILILPLYPQYAAATTGSVLDASLAALSAWRWVPALRFVNHYHAQPGYIAAVASRITKYWDENTRGDHLLLSFHGVPQDTFLAGDPYHCQCHATARLIAEQLRLADEEWNVCFQSRFGPKQWLQPYTETRLRELASDGVRRVDIACPGFAADCLETLEEIALRYAEVFTSAGGTSLRYIPALNDDPAHIDALVDLIRANVSGWNEVDPHYDPSRAAAERDASRARAEAMKS